MLHLNCKFIPNKETWAKKLGRNKNALDGNDLVDRQNEEIGLIITERYISDLKFGSVAKSEKI